MHKESNPRAERGCSADRAKVRAARSSCDVHDPGPTAIVPECVSPLIAATDRSHEHERFSGADCNGGDPYIYSQASFNGITLTVKATVPSTKHVIQYTLRQMRPGELNGKAVVTGARNSNTYD